MVYEALDHWTTGVVWMVQHASLYCSSQVLPLMRLDGIWIKHNGDLQGCTVALGKHVVVVFFAFFRKNGLAVFGKAETFRSA